MSVFLIGLIAGDLMSKTVTGAMEANIDKKFREYSDPQVNYAQPHVQSSRRKEMPRGLGAKDIFVTISVKLSRESQARGDDPVLAQKLSDELQGHLLHSTSFATTADNAKLILQVDITAVSVGDRFHRFFKNDFGYVRLGLSFTIYDATQPTQEIVKFGKIVYVDPLKACKFQKRCGKDSGEKALLDILPLTSRLLLREVQVDVSLGASDVV